MWFSCGGGSAGSGTGQRPRVDLPQAGATAYTTAAEVGGVTGDATSVPFVTAGLALSRGSAVTDGRLATLAAWCAPHARNGNVRPEIIRFFSHALGMVDPLPRLVTMAVPGTNARGEALTAAIADGFRGTFAAQPYTHYGATVTSSGALTTVMAAFSIRSVSLEAIDKGGPVRDVTLRGEMAGSLSNPVIEVLRPDQSRERLPAGAGPRFDVRVPLTAVGSHHIEILGRSSRGEQVVANFPVYVGSPPPTYIELLEEDDELQRASRSVELELGTMLSNSRRAASKQALERDAILVDVARAHSLDMATNGFLGHESPTTRTPNDRVANAGIRTGLVRENVGRGYSAQEIHDAWVASSGHNANLSSEDVSHVGVGVVAVAEGARTAFFATQVFVNLIPVVDLNAAPGELLEAYNGHRATRGDVPLETEPNLQNAAQLAAARFFAEPSTTTELVVDDATGSLRRFSIAYERLNGVMVVVDRVEEAKNLQPIIAGDGRLARYVGIGVAQGTRPDVPANSIAVVVLLAYPRAAATTPGRRRR